MRAFEAAGNGTYRKILTVKENADEYGGERTGEARRDDRSEGIRERERPKEGTDGTETREEDETPEEEEDEEKGGMRKGSEGAGRAVERKDGA